nr:MAG TPA: hypothetical protein [Caudoviricetes sp.]
MGRRPNARTPRRLGTHPDDVRAIFCYWHRFVRVFLHAARRGKQKNAGQDSYSPSSLSASDSSVTPSSPPAMKARKCRTLNAPSANPATHQTSPQPAIRMNRAPAIRQNASFCCRCLTVNGDGVLRCLIAYSSMLLIHRSIAARLTRRLPGLPSRFGARKLSRSPSSMARRTPRTSSEYTCAACSGLHARRSPNGTRLVSVARATPATAMTLPSSRIR